MRGKFIFSLLLVFCIENIFSQNNTDTLRFNENKNGIISLGYGYPTFYGVNHGNTYSYNNGEATEKGFIYLRVEIKNSKKRYSLAANIAGGVIKYNYYSGAQGGGGSLKNGIGVDVFALGARFNYYIIDTKIFKLYGAIGGGLATGYSPPLYGEAYLGIRTALADHLWIYAEGGIGLTYGQIGLSFKM